MDSKKVLIMLSTVVIIGLGFLFYSIMDKGEPEETPETKEEVAVNESSIPEFDEEGKLVPMKFMGDSYTEESKLTLSETESENLAVINEELKKVKEEYKMDVAVYQGKETDEKKEEEKEVTEEGKITNFIVVFKNNGEKDFKQTFDFPCEYFLSIYEDENFLEMKDLCEKKEDQELLIKAGETHHFMLGKLFVENEEKEKERKIYAETPFGIFESTIDMQ